jgi:hypothetical protein
MTDSAGQDETDRPAFSLVRTLRWVYLLAALLLIVLLIILSIYGARIGVGKPEYEARLEAQLCFNSTPMAALWIGLAVGLLAAPLAFPRLRSFGSLATHIGPGLVLIGALWGSQAMHDYRVAHLGETRVRFGIMPLQAHVPEGTVFPEPSIFAKPDDTRPLPVTLPFSLRLERFWLKLYNPWPEKWGIFTRMLCMDGQVHSIALRDWTLHHPAQVTQDVSLVVYRYEPHSRANPQLRISVVEPATTTMPERPRQVAVLAGRAGEQFTLDQPKTTVRIVRAFNNLDESRGEPEDMPGPPIKPALQVEITPAAPASQPAQEAQTVLVRADGRERVEQLELTYRMWYDSDPSSPFPAALVAFFSGGHANVVWLVPPDDPDGVVCQSWPYQQLWPIGLVRYDPGEPKDVRSYNARVTVRENGDDKGSRVIQVNKPLHYAGYHIYQMSYDQYRNDSTILRVVCDAGLAWVYAGFFVGVVGVFWRFWGVPTARWLKRRRGTG